MKLTLNIKNDESSEYEYKDTEMLTSIVGMKAEPSVLAATLRGLADSLDQPKRVTGVQAISSSANCMGDSAS